MSEISLIDSEVVEREQRRAQSPCPELWGLLDSVVDPEIPVLSLWELGVLQDVSLQAGVVEVVITPTYSGCPALDTMKADIKACLRQAGFHDVSVSTSLEPIWGTHLMSESAQDKLRDFRIAPPLNLACPLCSSTAVSLISEFSSTACKALYRCDQCGEPFDYFKPL